MRWSAPITLVLVLATVFMVTSAGVPLDDPLWWYTNTTPPSVVVDGPPGGRRGSVDVRISLSPATRAQIVSLTVDGRPQPATDSQLLIDSTKLADGPHTVQVVARDRSRRQNQTVVDWSFVSDNTGPRLDVRVEPSERAIEGHTLLVRVTADEPTAGVQGMLDDRGVRLQPNGADAYWLVTGIPPDPPYASRRLRIQAVDGVGNETVWERTLPLQRTAFPEELLDLDPATVGAQARAAENARLEAIYQRENGGKRWDGPFRVPVEGPVTTEFGTRRSYEYHPGTDLAAAMGASVMAPASGVVVLTAETPARGNVLVLDHGAGVYSTYGHLQRFEVEVGDEVRRGQLIGRVGSTGFSTGPHLHWELWVDGANVDPMEWTLRSFP